MAGFLRGLFETKGAPQNPIPRATSNSSGGVYTGAAPNLHAWDTAQAVNRGYERVIWVYRCIDTIASNASRVPMVVREYNDQEGKDVEDKELTFLLNRRVNVYEDARQFRYRVASQALLSRRGVFIEVVRNRAGRPSELHILPPDTTTPITDDKKYVSGYRVQTISQGIVELPPDRVIWIRTKPHPTDVYAQMTPLVAAGLAADTDYLARLYNRNFLANDGRPGMLVAVHGQLGDEDAEEIKRRFSGGPQIAGQTTVIEADGISATDMGSNPRDVQWQTAVQGSKDDILLAFGVPESVMGNASGRTYDNADAEAEVFWKVTMQPFMDAMAAGFDPLTVNGMDDDFYVAHDYNTVDVLQRQERMRHDKALIEFQSGVLTIDQYLEVIGRDQFKMPGTEVLWIPQGMVPIGKDDATTEAAAKLAVVGTPQMPGEEEQQANSYQGAYQGSQMGSVSALNDNMARALRLAGKQDDPFVETKALPPPDEATIEYAALPHPYWTDRLALEAEIGGHLSAWSKRQERAVIERLGGTKARKSTRHWEGSPGTKALNAQYIVNPEQWADDLSESLDDVLRVIAEKEALKAARIMDKAGIVDKVLASGGGDSKGRTALDRLLGADDYLGRNRVLERPSQAVKDMVRESALRQSQKVADRIMDLDKQGMSMDEIKKEVRNMVSSRSSWRRGLGIAAATSIMEGSRNEVYALGGEHVKRVWRTMHDERVRPTHRKAYGQRRTVTNPFLVGGAHLMYPGDVNGPIEEWANCRCWTEFVPR